MSILAALTEVEAWVFLAALSLIILYRFVSGGIDIGQAQLNRAQLLISIIGVAAYYLASVVVQPDAGELPFVPDAVMAALGGSNLIYLANKLAQLWPAITQSSNST
jgi:hypothetical protein